MLRVPRAAFLVAFTVIVDEPEPGAAIGLGLKVTVSPLSIPDAERLIAELKLPPMVVVTVPDFDPDRATESEAGAESVKDAGLEEVTISVTFAVWVTPSPVPVTVME
jgi:hypothetical protein